MTPSFDALIDTLLENLKGDMFTKPTYRKEVSQNLNTPIQNLEELKSRVLRLLPKSVKLDLNKKIVRGTVNDPTSHDSYELQQSRREALRENWTTMLFRGHKVPNPFSKTGDSKASGDKVYWGKDPRTALLYATTNSSWGTTGQQYVNIIQKAVANSAIKDGGTQIKYNFGYFSIAQPKHPEKLKWYKNFGVEDEEKAKREAIKNMKDKHMKENPHKTFNGLPADYKLQNTYGYDKNEWDTNKNRISGILQNKTGDQFQYNTSAANFKKHKSQLGVPYSGADVLSSDAETALSFNEITKLRTYLIFNETHMLSLSTIKQLDPILYQVLINDSL
jgi:hypothetical protein